MRKVDPVKACAFAALALALYLVAATFGQYSLKLPQHLENVNECRTELRLLYRNKVVPILKEINDFLGYLKEYQIARATNALLATVTEISERVTEFHWKIKIEELKVTIFNCLVALAEVVLGIAAVGSSLFVTREIFQGRAVVGKAVAFFASVGVSFVAIWKMPCRQMLPNLDGLEEQLEKQQEDIYEYKEQINSEKVKSGAY